MENVNEYLESDIIYGVFTYAKNKDELIQYPGLMVHLCPTLEKAQSKFDMITTVNEIMGRSKYLKGIEIMKSSKKEINWELIYSKWKT